MKFLVIGCVSKQVKEVGCFAGEECTHAEGSCQQCAKAHKDGSHNNHREQAQAAKDSDLGPDKLTYPQQLPRRSDYLILFLL